MDLWETNGMELPYIQNDKHESSKNSTRENTKQQKKHWKTEEKMAPILGNWLGTG
jgi:hypothetical protein